MKRKKKSIVFPCPVKVIFDNKQKLSGSIPLLPAGPTPGYFSPLSRVLNGDREFLPFEDAAGKEMLIGRKKILTIEADFQDSREGEEAFSAAKFDYVSLTIYDGTSVSGILSFSAPKSQSRMSDFFNRPDVFVVLEKEGGLFYVRKSAISVVSFWDEESEKPC